jgi:hypothetical protein
MTIKENRALSERNQRRKVFNSPISFLKICLGQQQQRTTTLNLKISVL